MVKIKMTSMTLEEMQAARARGESQSDWARIKREQAAGLEPAEDEGLPKDCKFGESLWLERWAANNIHPSANDRWGRMVVPGVEHNLSPCLHPNHSKSLFFTTAVIRQDGRVHYR